MVAPDFEAAARIIAALNEKGVEVDTAAWIQDPETETWRLVIANKASSALGRREIYRYLEAAFSEQPELRDRLPDVQIVPPSDRGIEDLRRLGAASVEPIAAFPSTTLWQEPVGSGFVYNIEGLEYENELFRALQRISSGLDMILRRAERVLGGDVFADFVVDRSGHPVLIEAKRRVSGSIAMQIERIQSRIPFGWQVLLVSPDPLKPVLLRGIDHVQWRSPEDDERLKEKLVSILG